MRVLLKQVHEYFVQSHATKKGFCHTITKFIHHKKTCFETCFAIILNPLEHTPKMDPLVSNNVRT
jgi:hypothetical protein